MYQKLRKSSVKSKIYNKKKQKKHLQQQDAIKSLRIIIKHNYHSYFSEKWSDLQVKT